jgi:MFS family permease
MSSKKSPLVVIFFTVFIYLVGFGIIIPMLPLLARDFGADSFQVGLLLSVYSLMQFLFAPFWGKVSDRLGRRPVLLGCLVGESFSYVIFAWARQLEWLFVARILAGFFGASISTASAYISDVTPAKERSKGMALIGAAFGLGFLIGPALGGGLAILGGRISSLPHFNTSFAAAFVGVLCLANAAFGFKFLKESLQLKTADSATDAVAAVVGKKGRFEQLFGYLKRPLIGPLISVFFLSSLAMSTMEATLVLLAGDRFHWGIREVSFGFAYIGLIIVLAQGFLVRRLLPQVGERRMLVAGLTMMGFGIGLIAFSPNIPVLAVAMTILALGSSFTSPSTMGSISLVSDAREQGAVLGTAQGTASLGRIIGPAFGGLVYEKISLGAPFISGGVMAFIGLGIILTLFQFLPESAKHAAAEGQA